MRLWIVGTGMLGKELQELCTEREIFFIASDMEVDITVQDTVLEFARIHKPDAIINCAAYTAVDKAQEQLELCTRINALGAQHLAKAAHEVGAALVQISTDYVFSGQGCTPLKESDVPAPLNHYGASKYEGELLALQYCPNTYVLRTAWLYGVHGKNFVYTMLKFMGEKPELGVVGDQYGTPTWTKDLALTILKILEVAPAPGVYHYSNAGSCSWHEFALAIQTEAVAKGWLKNAIPIKALTTPEYPTPAPRPAYSVMCKDKIKKNLGIEIPRWEESLHQFMGTIDWK
jgi:dTDP-4-dehydrorhamnose reductase